MMKLRAVAIGLVAATSVLWGQTPTLDYSWVLSAEAAAIESVPSHRWLADGTLLYWDETPEGFAAGIRRLDPVSGETSEFLDLAAVAEATMRLDPTRAGGVGFPDEIDEQGRHAVFVIDGDLFVHDIAANRSIRLTATEGAEHAARLSPDGRRVAFVRDNDLWAVDIAGGATVRLTSDGTATTLNGTLSWVYWEEIFGRQDQGYWWSPDANCVAFLRTDESTVGVAYFLDHRSLYPTLIEQRYPKAGTANPSVRVGIATISADAPEPVWIDFGAHEFEYVARVVWLPDGRRLAVTTLDRSQRRLDLFIVDRRDGKASKILTETDPGWVNVHDDLVFIKDGNEFLWASERTGYNHIYRYAIDGTLLGAVTTGDWAVRDTGEIFWLRRAIKHVDEAAGKVYFSGLKDASIENHLYSTTLEGGAVERVSDRAGTHSISFSPRGTFFVDRHSTISTPPSLTVHRDDGAMTSALAVPNTRQIEKLDLVSPELIRVEARDGFKMPAWIYKPKTIAEGERLPVVVYGYGGPSAPSVADAWQGADFFLNNILVQNGFAVACIDNRSATAISKTLENSIVGQGYGDSELADLVDGVHWLKQQNWCDPTRVGLWGWSGGGTLTLLGLTRTSEFKAGIAVAAGADWRYYDTRWTEAFNRRPQDNPAGYEHTNLVARAKNLHGRLLLVHGTYDDNVHIQNAWNFVDALIAAEKPFEMMIYPMRKHGIADRPARLHLYRTMLDFWKRNL